MTNRVALPAQDFQKMCKQAERDHEAKKLVVLMERVRQQIAAREKADPSKDPSRASVTAISANAPARMPSRSSLFER